MKDVLELRPVWHRAEERVRAQVLVASLALAIDRVLERKLRKVGLQLSTQAAGSGRDRDIGRDLGERPASVTAIPGGRSHRAAASFGLT